MKKSVSMLKNSEIMTAKLTALLENAIAMGCMHVDEIAESLVESGVVVLPCRVGDKLYAICDNLDYDVFVIETLSVNEVGTTNIFCSVYSPPGDDIDNVISIDELGVSVFLSYDEAVSALEKRGVR